jgi:hypothetical protein
VTTDFSHHLPEMRERELVPDGCRSVLPGTPEVQPEPGHRGDCVHAHGRRNPALASGVGLIITHQRCPAAPVDMVAGGVARRLRRLRAALASPAAGTAALILHEEVELIPHDQPRQHTDSVGSYPRSERWTADGHRNFGSRGAGAPLLQDEGGAVLPSEFGRLAQEKAAAVAADDYRTAAAVQSIIQVVTPRATPLPKPLAEYMVAPNFDSTDVRAAADFFLENGFCVVPGIISEATLQRVRAGWPAAESEARALWEARAAVSRGRWGLSWASGAPTGYRTFFDLGLQPEPGGEHWALARALVEVAAHPGLIETGKLLLGGSARVLGFPGGRVVPPEVKSSCRQAAFCLRVWFSRACEATHTRSAQITGFCRARRLVRSLAPAAVMVATHPG